jgi:predicted nucleic acid-binding Zn finger protein
MDKNVFLAIVVALVLLCAGCVNPPIGVNNSKTSTGTNVEVQGLFGTPPKEYKVEYENTMVTDGEEAKSTNAIYYRGETQMRMDSFIGEIETRFYINKEEFITCNKYATGWSCMKLSDAESSGQTPDLEKETEDVKKSVEEEKATRLPDRVIAGVTCKCFYMKVSYNIPQAQELSNFESTYCISPEGIPLYTESKSSAMHSIRQATKYSTKLSDADFVPPAKVMTMEEYLQSGGEST